ncbi:signal recognition particle subunit SRP68 [Zootermopsis nevadensis]|uniref:Signal recognition particle subunit SRP68 n=1 Tax=Zootermopsis nevadensis TaxID=136037 RepID=A0A067RMM2_ZOONE|nr:signal recognition particle subunit SRP68 [Zootermopsis nevadensis]KDR24278.1 Signal recognition particle 68 kDa protein [Zootermopsis nevadensis]
MVVQEDTCAENKFENHEEFVDSQSESEPAFTIEILKIIKEAQQQHGLRHSDYQRYRGYCSRRIRRLRKVLHVTQGDKRHFKRKDVTEAMLKDERYLYIPLMIAERAWSYAMQLRQEANTEPRKRFHLISRLRKATTNALHLQTLCESSKCDARTKLEAQAYVAWIHGSLHFELQMWMPAMENLKKAQMVYEKLALALPEDEQPVYKSRVEELAPSLRFCAYNIGDESAIDDLLQMRGHGQGDLLANLDSLMVQTQRRSEILCDVEWRGHAIPVRPERVRGFLLSQQQLDTSLARSADTASKITLLETLLMDCKDAIAAVRDELKADPNTKARTVGTPLTPLQHLLSYLTHIRLTRTIQRNLLMVESAQAALSDKNEGGGEGRRTRPQDLTRLYEIILQNYGEMQLLTGLEDDLQYQQEIETKIKAYRAFRCFYIAQSLIGFQRWREGMALYQRAEQYVKEALEASNASVALESKLCTQLQTLQHDMERQLFSAHAHSVLEGEGLQDEETGSAQVGTKTNYRSKKPLYERLGEYREDSSLVSRTPSVYKLPPEMQPIPCKPLFFDLAFNFVEFPSLEDKIEAAAGGKKGGAGLTGFVKGLWGWGGSGKK